MNEKESESKSEGFVLAFVAKGVAVVISRCYTPSWAGGVIRLHGQAVSCVFMCRRCYTSSWAAVLYVFMGTFESIMEEKLHTYVYTCMIQKQII